jgi:hypothetical protein
MQNDNERPRFCVDVLAGLSAAQREASLEANALQPVGFWFHDVDGVHTPITGLQLAPSHPIALWLQNGRSNGDADEPECIWTVAQRAQPGARTLTILTLKLHPESAGFAIVLSRPIGLLKAVMSNGRLGITIARNGVPDMRLVQVIPVDVPMLYRQFRRLSELVA